MKRSILILLFQIFISTGVCSQINIWEGTSCKEKVVLTPYLAEGDDNIAVVICPGGSYFWLDTETEGAEVAKWLQNQGISAFVLEYRTASVSGFLFHYRLLARGHRYPDPQDDLTQALKHIRNNADNYGIDPTKVGAMGFSAGGHLVMSVAELKDAEERPNFVVPVYPVVTMKGDYVHKRSRRALFGEDQVNNTDLQDMLSLEHNVPDDCPPVFLINCKDDKTVKYQNSELLASALKEKEIPHVYIQYETGGHGFGASEVKGTEECRKWKSEFLKWIKSIYSHE